MKTGTVKSKQNYKKCEKKINNQLNSLKTPDFHIIYFIVCDFVGSSLAHRKPIELHKLVNEAETGPRMFYANSKISFVTNEIVIVLFVNYNNRLLTTIKSYNEN